MASAGKWVWRGGKRVWATCKTIRCKVKTHMDHTHYFPQWPGKVKNRHHVQVICWLDKAKGSRFINVHIPF